MNEKIKLLAGQALDRVVPYTWTRLDYDEIQRLQEYFAELIVRECAQLADDTSISGPPTGYTYGNVICEHFGVEE